MKKQTVLPELSLKYNHGTFPPTKITSCQVAYDLLMELYDPDTITYLETSIVLYLNRAGVTIGWTKLSVGGTTCTIVDPKVVYSTALLCGAASLIVSHNHPSGEVQPSKQDIRLTHKLKDCGALLEITLIDHVIVTQQGYYSFNGEGVL